MALVWRRNQTPKLETKAWEVFKIEENDYLIKELFDDLGYHVMLSDLNNVWEENLDSNKITRRSKVRRTFESKHYHRLSRLRK